MEIYGIRCPICGQPNVQKISGIVSTGSIHAQAYGYGGAAYASSQANISLELSLPPFSKGFYLTSLIVGIAILVVGVPCTLFEIGNYTATQNYSAGAPPFSIYIPALLGLVITIVSAALWIAMRIRWRQKIDAAYPAWSQMYYCFRDDIAFLPGAPSIPHIPARALRKYFGF